MSSLIISGTPTPAELSDAWLHLWSEFLFLTASHAAEKHIDESEYIEKINSKLLIVSQVVEVLRMEYNEELVNELREWGYIYPFTPETLENDLQKVQVKLNNEETHLRIAEKAYADGQAERDSEHMTRQDYMKILTVIEDSKRYELDLDKLTASKFAIRYNRLIEEHKRLKALNDGKE